MGVETVTVEDLTFSLNDSTDYFRMCRDSTPEEVLAVLSLVHGEARQVFGGRKNDLRQKEHELG